MPAIGRPLPASHPTRHETASVPADLQGSWVLRPVVLEDAEEITRLEHALFPDEAWDIEMVTAEIAHPCRHYCAAVTVDAGTIVGYAGIMVVGDTADLHTIGTVRESHGIGRALLTWCEESASRLGAQRLVLEVRVDNTRARHVYARAGFHDVAVRPGYYRTARGVVDAIVMDKVLASPATITESPTS